MEKSNTTQDSVEKQTNLLSLPAELLVMILEYAFSEPDHSAIFSQDVVPKTNRNRNGLILNDDHNINSALDIILLNRQIYQAGVRPAFRHANFVLTNLFARIPERLSILHPAQVANIRHITIVADARHFRTFADWGEYPFGLSTLQLDTLTIALHRSSFWHYLIEHTADLVQLLRDLQGVHRLVFLRNGALVKGSFRTWYNRLVGLIMKVDHAERFDRSPSRLERTWWTWGYDEYEQRIWLEARPPKPEIDEETYLTQILPLMEDLRDSIMNEEWNADPRSRMLYP